MQQGARAMQANRAGRDMFIGALFLPCGTDQYTVRLARGTTPADRTILPLGFHLEATAWDG